MRLILVVLLSSVLSSVAETAEGSVQYRPMAGKADYRSYRPMAPAVEQSTAYTPRSIESSGLVTVSQADGNVDKKNHPKQNSIAQAMLNTKDNLAFEKKWELDPLSRPKVNLIPAADISKYHFSDRYLDLGDAEVSHYFILQEDYVFRNLNGRSDKIPAGFIWDGASIPKTLGAVALEVGNTRYNSVLAEGLIHDYMYRNPQRYTKKEADDLFYDNLKRCNNPDAMAIYKGVDLFGDDSYRRHWNNQRQGYYDVFTPEFYAGNLKTFQSGNDSTLEKKEEKRKICTCASPDVFFAGVCRKKVGVINNKLWAQYYCRNCGGFRRGSVFELMQTDKGIAVYPAGSVPFDWDGKIYEQSELDAYVMSLIENANGKTSKASAGEDDKVRTLDSPSDKPISNKSNASQNRRTQGDSQRNGSSPQGKITVEDVISALREDGSGIEAVSTLLR